MSCGEIAQPSGHLVIAQESIKVVGHAPRLDDVSLRRSSFALRLVAYLRHATFIPVHLRYGDVMRSLRTVLLTTLCVVVSSLLAAPIPSVASPSRTCATGGVCRLGDTGPGGGVVFYVAAQPQWWGQYLEARSTRAAGVPWITTAPAYIGADRAVQRVTATWIGHGKSNTETLLGIAAAQSDTTSLSAWSNILERTKKRSPNGYDWYVPSKDELDALFNFVATRGSSLSSSFPIGLRGSPYWTSSEASDSFAWYQLFQDGTQFTDANGIVRGLVGNKNRTTSSVHTGSAFPALPMRLALIRPFASAGTVLPRRPDVPVIPRDGRPSSSCAMGTACQVGDIGPAGGVVFYDAGSPQSWGRWLEASPAACEGSAKSWRATVQGKRGTTRLPSLYPVWSSASRRRIESKLLGMGRVNTQLIMKQHNGLPAEVLVTTAAGFADLLSCGGKDDWFLPSKDELDVLHGALALSGHDLSGTNAFGFSRGFYWTSSEYNNDTAWTQLWVDGQQFDREKWLNGDKPRNAERGDLIPFRVRPVRAFG